MSPIDSPAIEIHGLECRYVVQKWSSRYESDAVVKNLSLQVPRGSVYALLGTNGAGKSTLIRALLNLIAPTRGTVNVLGKPSTAFEPEDWSRIGYVSESQTLPEYLTLEELVAYCRPLYANWDDTLCEKLRDQFALPWKQTLKTFSRGMKLKAALVTALSYRPALLVLDEPFGGLDVLTRDELIQGMLELAGDEDWTIFLTSHDLDEIERLADWVGVMDQGVLHLSEPLETLRERFRRVDVVVPGETPRPVALPESCLLPEIGPRSARWIDSHYAGEDAVSTHIASLFGEGTAFATTPLSLREILIAFTRSQRLNPLAS